MDRRTFNRSFAACLLSAVVAPARTLPQFATPGGSAKFTLTGAEPIRHVFFARLHNGGVDLGVPAKRIVFWEVPEDAGGGYEARVKFDPCRAMMVSGCSIHANPDGPAILLHDFREGDRCLLFGDEIDVRAWVTARHVEGLNRRAKLLEEADR